MIALKNNSLERNMSFRELVDELWVILFQAFKGLFCFIAAIFVMVTLVLRFTIGHGSTVLLRMGQEVFDWKFKKPDIFAHDEEELERINSNQEKVA